MPDPKLIAMFHAMVLPTMRQMPTDELKEIQTFLNEQIGQELARRNDALPHGT